MGFEAFLAIFDTICYFTANYANRKVEQVGNLELF
jgi:hypothetical protein